MVIPMFLQEVRGRARAAVTVSVPACGFPDGRNDIDVGGDLMQVTDPETPCCVVLRLPDACS